MLEHHRKGCSVIPLAQAVQQRRDCVSVHRTIQRQFVAQRAIPVTRVARRIVKAAIQGKTRVFVGMGSRFIDLAKRCCPVLTDRLLARYTRRLPFV